MFRSLIIFVALDIAVELKFIARLCSREFTETEFQFGPLRKYKKLFNDPSLSVCDSEIPFAFSITS